MRVLIVDDEHINVMLLERLFKQIGNNIDISIVNNGKDAVDLCKDNFFNTILMDIRMPVMGGFEATKLIKKLRKDIPIVAVTTYPFDFIDKDYKEAGFDYYMQKPVNIDILKKYLESLKN